MDPDTAIEVSGLGKKYFIGEKERYLTLRDSLVNAVKTPLLWLSNRNGSEKKHIWALRDVSFTVKKGEVVGVIGKNGAGKTTLLKILSRITEPTLGEVKLRGRVSSLLEVGTGFHPEFTGRENIYLNGTILGMKRAEIDKKFDEIVEFSGVEKFLDTPVKRYSSGMRVRLAFSVAAYLEPEILLVDEVLAVGDAEFQKKSMGRMKDIGKSGRTVLFVSHNINAVKSLCQKGILLEDGKINYIGDVDITVEKYLSLVSQRVEDVPLGERQRDQHLTQEARFIDLHLITEEGKSRVIDTKKPLTARFTIWAAKDLNRDFAIHMAVMRSGQMILRFQSEYANQTYRLKRGKNIIDCRIQPLYLVNGDYTIDCSILFIGSEHLGHIDFISEAYMFSIKNCRPLQKGIEVTQLEAIYYVEHDWTRL